MNKILSFMLLFVSSLALSHSMTPSKEQLNSVKGRHLITKFTIKNHFNQPAIFEMEGFERLPGTLGNPNAKQTNMIKFSPRKMKVASNESKDVAVMYVRKNSNPQAKKDAFWICSVKSEAPDDNKSAAKAGMKTRICSKLDIIKK